MDKKNGSFLNLKDKITQLRNAIIDYRALISDLADKINEIEDILRELNTAAIIFFDEAEKEISQNKK